MQKSLFHRNWRVKNLNTRQRLGFFCQSFWTLARGALSEESTVPRILVSWTESTNGCHISSIFPATISRSSTLVPEAAVFGAKLFTLYFLLTDMLTLPESFKVKVRASVALRLLRYFQGALVANLVNINDTTIAIDIISALLLTRWYSNNFHALICIIFATICL